jgi:hypothetical protein
MTSPAAPEPDSPGKIRTWWHPLVAGFLRWQLRDHYEVQEEVPVGKKPLQIDAGYTELVVYMAQQVEQFRRLGKEFAMQHLGAENEMLQTLKDMYSALPVEERLEYLTTEERLKGLSPEQVFEALSPEALDRLKQLMQERAKVDDNTNPK